MFNTFHRKSSQSAKKIYQNFARSWVTHCDEFDDVDEDGSGKPSIIEQVRMITISTFHRKKVIFKINYCAGGCSNPEGQIGGQNTDAIRQSEI